MRKDFYQDLDATREKLKLQFYDNFNKAQTLQDLIMAYAKYTGALEGLLDTLEISLKAGDRK